MITKYQIIDDGIQLVNLSQETLDAFEAQDVERRPVWLPETDTRVVEYLAARPTQKSINIKKIDDDVDAIYDQAIGNRGTEYSEAELQAAAYKGANYVGSVPAYVASWLAGNTKGYTTAAQAADDILAQAAAWRGAAAAIRATRLLAKKNVADDQPMAMAEWNAFVTAIRAQLFPA
ncbi:MAG: hypothetical protein Q7K57_25015 [Burkholderiaceae bacterium]|nr:hypothetical protein [Burkholderiaceae bacterium]